MIEYTKQQIVQNYKFKMQILLKVTLITILSSILMLLLFDYQDSQYQLDLSSKVNCIQPNSDHQAYICNTCFKFSKPNKFKQGLSFQSQKKFTVVGLNDNLNEKITCEEWIQTIDYETPTSRQNLNLKSLEMQPIVQRWLKSIEKQHNQSLRLGRSSSQNFQSQKQTFNTNLLHSNYVLFYESDKKDKKEIRLFYQNRENQGLCIHIIRLLSISSFIALLYIVFCTQKKLAKFCGQYVLNVVGVLLTFIWAIFGNLDYNLALFTITCKIVFFSITFYVVFDAGRWLFFGLIFLVQSVIVLLFQPNSVGELIFSNILLLTIVWKVSEQIQDEYFHFQKNSNKKIYFLMVSFMVIVTSCLYFLYEQSTLGYAAQFLICYLSMISMLIGTKNMDIENYSEFFGKKGKNQGRLQTNTSVSGLGETSMYEEGDGIQQSEMRQVKK